MKGTWRVIVLLLIFWLFIVVYMNSTLFQQSGDLGEKAERQLQKALKELDALKQQNLQLQKLASEIRDLKVSSGKGQILALKNLQNKLKKVSADLKRAEEQKGKPHENTENIIGGGGSPGSEHEVLRRSAQNGVREMWFFVRSELHKLRKLTVGTAASDTITSILENGADHERVIQHDLKLLSESDGAKEWREKEARDLSDLVQKRLRYLQNPKDCNKAQKVLCNLNKGCGFGCQIHHLVYCMIIAYGTGRTLVLESKGWRYSSGGWEKVFLPLSETCKGRGGGSSRGWTDPKLISNIQVVELPIVDGLHPRPDFMPLSIPEDLAPRLKRLHGDPIVWWIGQILKYILRPQAYLEKDIETVKEKLGFKNPIVGVHVRRTDKVGTEAAFHGIHEYMNYVEEYFKRIDLDETSHERQVYLATDDPTVLADAKKRYPKYNFISDVEISKSAGLHSRYSIASLRGIILDIYFLSMSDYLVCTFSSQVCRVAYEIMQTHHPDAAKFFHSLDDIYYYGGQSAHDQVAIYPHKPLRPGEIELQVGDNVGIAGNHWDGYSKGTNRRTGKVGLYPSYKVREKVYTADMPIYPGADKSR